MCRIFFASEVIYIYIYVCVCVCEREREREREIIYICVYIYNHGISVNSFTVHFGWIIGYLFIRAIYI
jgi:hypothetical protein